MVRVRVKVRVITTHGRRVILGMPCMEWPLAQVYSEQPLAQVYSDEDEQDADGSNELMKTQAGSWAQIGALERYSFGHGLGCQRVF